MNLLIVGAYSPSYPRHRIITEGLRSAGHDLTLRTFPLGASTARRSRLILASLRDMHHFDAVIIPAFNQTFAPLVWAAAKAARVPVLLDYMVGLSDVNEDRQTIQGRRAQVYRQIDRFNLRTIPAVTDTRSHIQAFERLLEVDLPRLKVLPVGVVPDWLATPAPPTTAPLTALYIGTFIPFHGVDVILEAAALLRDHADIRIELIGSGQTFSQAEASVRDLALTHVTLTRGHFPVQELIERAAHAAVILGVFGAMEKTRYVVPNKVFDGMAMGRAVMTADSPALREWFTPGEHFIGVPPGRPDALADALIEAAANLQRTAAIGAAAAQRMRADFLPEQIGAQLSDILASLR
ncbi:MAG: glycosyltransferase [Chloroflexi bacterium]|nr:glycosyltransferase [Chloroflexota bacterium]